MAAEDQQLRRDPLTQHRPCDRGRLALGHGGAAQVPACSGSAIESKRSAARPGLQPAGRGKWPPPVKTSDRRCASLAHGSPPRRSMRRWRSLRRERAQSICHLGSCQPGGRCPRATAAQAHGQQVSMTRASESPVIARPGNPPRRTGRAPPDSCAGQMRSRALDQPCSSPRWAVQHTQSGKSHRFPQSSTRTRRRSRHGTLDRQGRGS